VNFFPEYDRKALDQVFQDYFSEMLTRAKAREEAEGGERKVRLVANSNENVAVISYDMPMLDTTDRISEFAETALRAYGCRHMVIKKDMLAEEFYDLPPSELSKAIRKLSGNSIRFAIVGDFSLYEDRSLYGALVDGGISRFFFGVADVQEALNMLRDDSCGET